MKGYRFLKDGEKIKATDQCYISGKWVDITGFKKVIGSNYSSDFRLIRRPIAEPGESK